jgi:hypothetical protein
MAFAADVAFFIDFVAAGGDDFGFQGHIALRHADAIEYQLQIAFAPEMAGIFGGFEMPYKIAAAREGLLSELGYGVQMAEDGVADGDGGRRKVRFVHGALQKGTGGQDHLTRTGTQGKSKKGCCKNY